MDIPAFHPDLRPLARFLPRSVHPRLIVQLLRVRERLRGPPKVPRVDGVNVRDVLVPGLDDAPAVRVRIYRPAAAPGPVPALLWIHGGGFVMGDAEIDQANNIALVRELGLTVASVNYRLAPRAPYPAPLEDCYAVLRWLHAEAAVQHVLPARIAIGGASAGAGLAAGVALMAHDRDEPPVAFQLLIYPMLDDRTAARGAADRPGLRLWDGKSNRFGWTSYLQKPPGGADVPAYAAPARRGDLSGLPPAWIGVGTLDLFFDEDVRYAERLTQAGVACELRVVDGAYHGFDLFSPRSGIVRQFRSSYVSALRRALFGQ